MRKFTSIALAAAAIVAGFVPSAVAEDQPSRPCSTDIYIFSYVGVDPETTVPGTVTPEATCNVVDPDVDGTPDPRLIYPHSTVLAVRYTVDAAEGAPDIPAIVDGLGYVNFPISLTRSETTVPGTFLYDSADLPIDPMATGSFTVTIPFVDEETGEETSISDTYRTVHNL